MRAVPRETMGKQIEKAFEDALSNLNLIIKDHMDNCNWLLLVVILKSELRNVLSEEVEKAAMPLPERVDAR